jgi:SNF2 family DNA or RNA helicase
MKWEHNFDSRTLQRGRQLHKNGGVLSLRFYAEQNIIIATVRGAEQPEYELEIELIPLTDNKVTVDSFCDCTVEAECKHAVAVMLEFEKRHTQKLVPVSRSVSVSAERWASQLADASEQTLSTPAPAGDLSTVFIYLLEFDLTRRFPLSVSFCYLRKLKTGEWGKPRKATQDFASLLTQEYISTEDRKLLTDLMFLIPTQPFKEVSLQSAAACEWLLRAVSTGNCCWMEALETQQLKAGEPRVASLDWEVRESGLQSPVLKFQDESNPLILPLQTPCYLDESARTLGAIELPVSAAVAQAWLNGPPIEPEYVNQMQRSFDSLLPAMTAEKLTKPKQIQVRRITAEPTPFIILHTTTQSSWVPHYFQTGNEDPIHAAEVDFLYGDQRVSHSSPSVEISNWTGEELIRFKRNIHREQDTLKRLDLLGFRPIKDTHHWISPKDPIYEWFSLPEEHDFYNFIDDQVPVLEQENWQFEYDNSFDLLLSEPDSWYVDMEQTTSGMTWFDTEIGVLIDGEKVNLLPLLLDYLHKTPPQALNRSLDRDTVLQLPDGKKIKVPADRMRLLSATLLELFSKETYSTAKTVQVPWIRAMELARLQETEAWEASLPAALQQNVDRFRELNELPLVDLPKEFNADLRSYQHQGVSWMQFLRELGFGAVLADDMGLGKTVQTLAHILIEKESGRMNSPCLIVAPTSVLHNWETESARFAPNLRIHVSHGPERAEFFETFNDNDLIITTYPLLVRDGKVLLDKEFHLVVLDEAQFIRNHKTQAARTVRLLKAHQRIALTGTPLENNLDELWSLFSFAVPSLLGDNALFRKMFRTPIEKSGNQTSRNLLAQRIAPFMLRRTKDEVVKELPPKTEIIQLIDLSEPQKALYETVRASLEKEVRDAIAEKGLARSRIIVLAALLKMRQVCCHPALLKLKAAEAVNESAKLEALRELVTELASEGRRVLIFSQFVSMIKLIEEMLGEEKVEYVKITGQTKDRKTPVETFQSGTVPVFLISLKAGGTGLNLTAADTVIHFDPWWNPAVENQATDRAYRIGQDKPVFVYKLISTGTIEEKIVELQQQKSELINSLLDEQKDVLSHWDESDINSFFAPLSNSQVPE